MAEQSEPAGQQRRVVFEARVMQLEPLGQQKLEGKPEPEQKSKVEGQAAEVVVVRWVRVTRRARARLRGVRLWCRIAVMGWWCSDICRFVFEAVGSSVEGRSPHKLI
jgi:hypothetical protein